MNYFPFHIINDENKIDIKELKTQLISKSDIKVFFSGDNIVCEKQITAALLRSYRSEKNGTMIAKKVPMEIYLQLAGNHQIEASLKLFELKDDPNKIIIVQTTQEKLITNSRSGYPAFSPDKTIMEKYNISSDNNNWCDLVIAKGARLVADYE